MDGEVIDALYVETLTEGGASMYFKLLNQVLKGNITEKRNSYFCHIYEAHLHLVRKHSQMFNEARISPVNVPLASVTL